MVRDRAYEAVEDDAGAPFAIDEFVEVFLKKYPAVLVFDIDGLEGQGAQYDEVARLESAGPEIWWDAGASREEDVIGIITSGADRAVVATRSLAGLDELRAAVAITENLVFEVTARGGQVAAASRDFAGRTLAQVAAMGAQAGVQDLLLLDTARPLGGAVDWETVRAAAGGFQRVYVGGGLEAAAVGGMKPPAGVPLAGAVVDLVSILSAYL